MQSSDRNAASLSHLGDLGQQWMSPVIRWTDQPVFREPPAAGKIRRFLADDLREWLRRALNVSIAAVSLILVLPVLGLIAIAVKVSSPGPVIYKPERVGLDRRRRTRDRRFRKRGEADRRAGDAGGRVFRMYKFRTMYENAGEQGEVRAKKDDPRITPVGRILRAYRLDELPQLWNVLRGQMNLVGPRPDQPTIFQEWRAEFTDYSRRQRILPGITGLAQINNGYGQSFRDVERRLAYDLQYLERRSLGEDVRILVRTVPVVLSRRGHH